VETFLGEDGVEKGEGEEGECDGAHCCGMLSRVRRVC
jgi:hypothetical protein